jgi:hypothetical protein
MELNLRILSTTIGEVGSIGLSCLFALHIAGRNVTEPELLATVHVDSISTLRKYLSNCAMHEYASMVKRSRLQEAFWHITDLGKSIVMRVLSLFGLPVGGLPIPATHPELTTPLDIVSEKKFFSPSSSSSDLINQSSESDQTDQIEEEEERGFKKYLCQKYNLTGTPAAALASDNEIYGDDICAWMYQVAQMKREGFKFRKSPEAYALACLLKHEVPSADALRNSSGSLDVHWRQFQQTRAPLEENDDDTAA